MKPTDQREAEILSAYNTYWKNYLAGNVAAIEDLLDVHYTQVGSAAAEVFYNKKDAVQFLQETIEQVAGKAEMRNQLIKVESVNECFLVHDLFDAYVQDGENWIFYAKFRASTLMQKIDGKWKFIHQHSSVPDIRTQDGENLAIDKIADENLQLKDAIKRRTVELEHKNQELELEASLERVRTVAMAMRKPDDLLAICKIQFNELKQLGFSEIRNALIGIFNDDKNYLLDYDYSDFSGGTIHKIPYNKNPLIDRSLKQMKSATDAFTEFTVEGEELEAWKLFRKQNGEYDDTRITNAGVLYYYFYSISEGNLGISTFEKISEAQLNILKKFRNVFDLAYSRYVDITKAEAQARESQIQLALERVRARTMAMQKSDELAEASFLLDSQVRALGIKTRGCAFNIYGDNESTEWFSSEMGTMPAYKTPRENLFLRYYEAGQKGIPMYVEEFAGDACAAHYEYLCTLPVMGEALKELKAAGGSFPVQQTDHVIYFKYGYLLFITLEPVPEAHDVFKRFAKVFEQTYTRFLDLQKAEAQAKESQIEAALEKVRSRSLAMHKSDEIKEVVKTVVEKIKELDIEMNGGVSLVTFSPDSKDLLHWIWIPEQFDEPLKAQLAYFDNIMFHDCNEAREKGLELIAKVYSGEEKKHYFEHIFNYSGFSAVTDDSKAWVMAQEYFGFSFAIQKHSGIFLNDYTGKYFEDETNQILVRFSRVFEQAYTRFLDLQKAEAQARESQIEAALERVRSRTLAMQKSEELAETSAVLFRQLILLGIEPNRLYITIILNERADAEFWITDEDGSKVSAAYTSNMHDNRSFEKMFLGWKEKKQSLIIDMQGDELQEYFSHLTSLNVPFKGGLTQHRRIQHLAYFNKGFIGMASPDDQPAETIRLLERFAAVFNLTYTRFNDLKLAEAHAIQAEEDLIKLQTEKKRAEDALAELQQTQKQLIQAEKMASLGELTAGIAHEIQNPLNFVNNFSEVSNELIEELRSERASRLLSGEKSERDEQLEDELLNDIAQNLEKINTHGKRADAIVKGMLQHSRSSSGVKEPTDLNALCDEYLRLSYHGLRAKDKSFNATLQTHFDASIGKINVIPQDMGRVILNLINNAFYAVDERKKQQQEGYAPTVTVSTAKQDDKITVSVKDNGNGIPKTIVDKIFQPFFTTKPTGQGTGLGLSLSYDIVKAHSGELKVETTEGEGTEFTILLLV